MTQRSKTFRNRLERWSRMMPGSYSRWSRSLDALLMVDRSMPDGKPLWIASRGNWVSPIGTYATLAEAKRAIDRKELELAGLDAWAQYEMDAAAAEQAAPRYQHFTGALRVAQSYSAALDDLHEEAWREDQLEHLGETIVEHDGKRMMIKDIPDGWVRRQLGYGHESDHGRSVIPVVGREWKATPGTCTYGPYGWLWTQHEGQEFLVCPRCGLDGT